jgi:endonuclease YncB( thermonuclease family)
MTLTLPRFAIGLVLALSVVSSGVARVPIIGVASVIDGDTIEIHGQRIRLFGITPPKAANSACGPMANAGVAGGERVLRCPIGSDAVL